MMKRLPKPRPASAGMSGFWRIVAILCLVALASGLVTNSSSAAGTPPSTKPLGGVTSSTIHTTVNQNLAAVATAPPTYQQQLVAILSNLSTSAAQNPQDYSKAGPNTSAMFATAAQDAVALTPDQLNGLYTALGPLPSSTALPHQIVKIGKYNQRLQRDISAIQQRSSNRFRAYDFNPTPPNDCSTKAFGNAIYGLTAVAITAKIAKWIAERIAESLPDSEVFGAIVLGEGTVITLPISPERAVAEAIVAGLELVEILAEGAKELMDMCNQDNFQELMTSFKDFAHAYIPIKSLNIKVVPVSAGSQFLVTATEDGIPVAATMDSIKAIVLGSSPKTATDVTSSTSAVAIPNASGVLLITPPTTPSAAAYELQLHSTDQTDPTAVDPPVSHTGVVTFTKASGG